MRVTSTLSDMQYYLQQSAQQYSTAQEQVATGLRVNNSADDPIAAAQYSSSLAASANVDQYTSNVTTVLGRLQSADSALSSVVTSLNSAITIGTEAANSTNNSSDLSGLAEDLENSLASIISQANTSYGGSYLFGGTENAGQPFMQAYTSFTSSNSSLSVVTGLTAGSTTIIGDASTGESFAFHASAGDTITTLQDAVNDAISDGTLSSGTTVSVNASGQLEIDGSQGISVTTNDAVLGSMESDSSTEVTDTYAYMGNSSVNQTQIGDGLTVDSNVAGDSFFTTGTGVLSALKGLITSIQSGSSSDIATAVTTLTTALNDLAANRVGLDNNISLLNSQETCLSSETVTLTSQQTSLVSIDLAEAATNLSEAQIANSAVLAAAAKCSSETLLDYLK